EESKCRLPFAVLVPIQLHEALERRVAPPRRNGGGMTTERGSCRRRSASNHDEVVRCRPPAHLAQAALESDARHVVLSPPIGKASDLDFQPGKIANEVLPIVQLFRQQPPQTARLRDGE